MENWLGLERHIHNLESQLLEPEVRASASALEALLAGDFMELGSSGRTFDRRQTVRALRESSDLRYTLADFRARLPGPDTVLATYRSTVRDGVSITGTLRSSVWIRRREDWQLVSHQGTLVPQTHPEA